MNATRYRSRAQRITRANDFSALNPVIWANEAILRLKRNMVIGNLVTRDFNEIPAIFGQLVNAFIPGTFVLTRKGAPCDNVVIQDATGTTMQVALDQWPQVAFFVCDGEEDRNFRDMLQEQYAPALDAFANGIDLILGGQVYRFLENWAGRLGQVDETNIKDYVLETREVMNRNNAPLAGRTMLLTPGTETEALKLDTLVTADKTGDGGLALREARLGRKYGFDFFSANGQPEVTSGQTTITATVNNAGGYAAGATTLTVSGASATLVAGQWCVIAGDDKPQHITATNGTTSITISPGLQRNVANSAAIVIVKPGQVNNAAGYAGTTTSPRVIGWAKEILIDQLPNSIPRIGQGVTFGTGNDVYTIIKLRIIDAAAGTFGIELDRPLVTTMADNATVNFLPVGKYNLAIIRQAMALINRPLNQPRSGTAVSRVINDTASKLSIRATISYDPVKQGHLVVLDTLIGVAFLNPDLAAVMGG